VFAVAEPTLFMGRLATYDAPAVFLLALSGWILVATAARTPATAALAAPTIVLAVFTKYACLLYLPSLVALAGLAVAAGPSTRGSPRRWRALVVRPLLLVSTVLATGALAARLAGPGFLHGVAATTTARTTGSDPVTAVASQAAQYLAGPLLLAALGAIWYAGERGVPPATRTLRALLGLVLTLTLVIAPIYQAHLHTLTSLQKHVGYGLVFAAPLTGLALMTLLSQGTRDPRRLGAVLGVLVLLAAAGSSQSWTRFHDWPDSTRLVAVLRTQVRPVTGRYLVEESEVPRYYLRDLTQPYQWTGTYFFQYTDHAGHQLSGVAAYRAAIAEKYFDVIALRYGPTAPLDVQIDGQLRAHDGYQLIATLPADSSYGAGLFSVWRAVR
jgi:hypothetical protein